MTTDSDRPYYSDRLLRSRFDTQRRRAAAMCLPDDTVLGITLRPLTPASYSRLFAIGNAFLFGGLEPTVDDIRNYIWFHAPGFTDDPRQAAAAKAGILGQLERYIFPPWLAWRYSRAAQRTRRAAGYALAATKIAEIVNESFADIPPPGPPGPSIGATLEAQFIDVFAREYRWYPERTSNTPIRQLYQFLRCINRTDFDADEARIIAEDLKVDNEALQRVRSN